MDKNEVKTLQLTLQHAVKEIGEAFGMEIKVGSISYGSDNFCCKIEGLAVGAESFDAQHYRVMATRDMPKLWDKVSLDGIEFTIIGWKRRASKYPILIKDDIGNIFKISRVMLLGAKFLCTKDDD